MFEKPFFMATSPILFCAIGTLYILILIQQAKNLQTIFRKICSVPNFCLAHFFYNLVIVRFAEVNVTSSAEVLTSANVLV